MIILICGLPRAGKTTYSKRYEKDCRVLHLDDYGGNNSGHMRCNSKADTFEDVVIEGVYNRADWRKSLIRPHYNTYKKCIWLDTPIEIKRTRHGYCSHCEYEFEPPTLDEGWDEIIIIRGEHEQRISR